MTASTKGSARKASDRASTTAQRTKGKVKETAGRSVGNDRLRAKGKTDQVKADVREAGHKVREKAGDLVEMAGEKVRGAGSKTGSKKRRP